MLRYQKGYIFNGYTFVVNKEDVHNAPDDLFVKGTALLPDGWISVKDRLPDTEERVLVCLDIKQTEPIKEDTDRYIDSRLYGRWVRWNGAVTHWMPLPPLPGEEDA